jgi:hypothetical protein
VAGVAVPCAVAPGQALANAAAPALRRSASSRIHQRPDHAGSDGSSYFPGDTHPLTPFRSTDPAGETRGREPPPARPPAEVAAGTALGPPARADHQVCSTLHSAKADFVPFQPRFETPGQGGRPVAGIGPARIGRGESGSGYVRVPPARAAPSCSTSTRALFNTVSTALVYIMYII